MVMKAVLRAIKWHVYVGGSVVTAVDDDQSSNTLICSLPEAMKLTTRKKVKVRWLALRVGGINFDRSAI